MHRSGAFSGSTQQDASSALGMSLPTVRAIEGGNLKLSPKFAARLSQHTGVPASLLLKGSLGKRSDDTIRDCFFNPPRNTGALAQAVALRTLVNSLLVAEELGAEKCLRSGYYDLLQTLGAKMLWLIPDASLRQRIFERSRKMTWKEMRERIEVAILSMKDIKRP